jgi:hypothetical protein
MKMSKMMFLLMQRQGLGYHLPRHQGHKEHALTIVMDAMAMVIMAPM